MPFLFAAAPIGELLLRSRFGSLEADIVVTGTERLAHSQGATLFVLLQPSPIIKRLLVLPVAVLLITVLPINVLPA